MKMKRLGMFVLVATLFFSAVGTVSAQGEGFIVLGSQNPSASGIAMDTVGALDIAVASGFCSGRDGYSWEEIIWEDSRTGKVDSEVTYAMKMDDNMFLIVIAGPVANAITKELVNRGKCTINWKTSPGEVQYIEDAWGYNTADVLVVGGKDRWATREICWLFANDMVYSAAGHRLAKYQNK